MKNIAIDGLKTFGFKVYSRTARKVQDDLEVEVSVYRDPNSLQRRLEFKVMRVSDRAYLVGGSVDGIFPELESYLSDMLAFTGTQVACSERDTEYVQFGTFLSDLADKEKLRSMIPTLLDGRCLVSVAARAL